MLITGFKDYFKNSSKLLNASSARMHASSAAGSDYFEAAAAVDAGIIRTAGRAQIKDLKDHSVSPEMEAFPRVLFALGVILFGATLGLVGGFGLVGVLQGVWSEQASCDSPLG
jgi:hypothetical protein